MIYHLRCNVNLLFLLFGFISFPCSASDLFKEYPSLIMHGATYSSACQVTNQKALQNVLSSNGVKASAQVWKLIDIILCSTKDKEDRAYVAQRVQKKLRRTVESTGEKPDVKTVERSAELIDDLLAEGRAWDANIRVEPGKIFLQYFSSEACVKAVNFSLRNGKWLVHELSVACD